MTLNSILSNLSGLGRSGVGPALGFGLFWRMGVWACLDRSGQKVTGWACLVLTLRYHVNQRARQLESVRRPGGIGGDICIYIYIYIYIYMLPPLMYPRFGA